MTSTRSIRILLASAAVAAAALATGAAQARSDVYWSVGVGAPGAQVVLGNAPPLYVAPAPVYLAPRPVYYPQPAFVQPRPVYVQGPPVYLAPPPPLWVRPGYDGWRHHGRGHGPYGHGGRR